jgi:hypothetical protein
VTDAADIDALLAAAKTLPGAPRWVRDPRSPIMKLSTPVAVEGVVGGLSLRASALIETEPQRGSAALVYEGQVIQRVLVHPDHPHFNPFAVHAPSAHRGVRLPSAQSRIYPWRLNRIWPRPGGDNASFAELIAGDVSTFAEALTIFLGVCHIDGDLPPLVWEPRLI